MADKHIGRQVGEVGEALRFAVRNKIQQQDVVAIMLAQLVRRGQPCTKALEPAVEKTGSSHYAVVQSEREQFVLSNIVEKNDNTT